MPLSAKVVCPKFFDVDFNPIFNNKKISIYKKRFNKNYVKLNCASNGANNITYIF
jgi:hypothetical protein